MPYTGIGVPIPTEMHHVPSDYFDASIEEAVQVVKIYGIVPIVVP